MPGPSTHPRSSNLWFRVAVPDRLREKVGKREIKFSLGTSDPELAKIRQAQELARWRACFLELDREIDQEALSRAPALVDSFLKAMAQRNGDYDSVVYGIQKFIVLRLFSAWGHEEFSVRDADRVFAFMPNREAWREGDRGADADLIPEEEREETLARVLVLNRSRDTQGLGFSEVLQRLLSAGRWRVLDIEVAMVADHAGTEIADGTALFDTVAEQLLRRLVYHVPRHVDEKVARYFSRVEPVPGRQLGSGREAPSASVATRNRQGAGEGAAPAVARLGEMARAARAAAAELHRGDEGGEAVHRHPR